MFKFHGTVDYKLFLISKIDERMLFAFLWIILRLKKEQKTDFVDFKICHM